MKLIDISGQRFGRLLVIHKDAAPKMWHCACDCGAAKLVTGGNLRNGSIRSCGCLAREFARKNGANPETIAKRAASMTRHGHKRRSGQTCEYRTWLAIKRRCSDTKYKDFPNWGGRGILVCERWDSSFEAFLSDMGPRPAGMSIDRHPDNNGNYEPGNCRWATAKQQAENRRSTISVTVGDLVFPSVSAAAKHYGVSVSVAHMRIKASVDPAVAVSERARLRPRR